MTSTPSRTPRPGLGPPGFNPLFIGVVLSVIIGIIAAVEAGHGKLAGSGILFHFAVGGGVTLVLYFVTSILWFGWHRRTLQQMGLGAASGAAPPDQSTPEEKVEKRDAGVAEFMKRSTETTEQLLERVERLEGRRASDEEG